MITTLPAWKELNELCHCGYQLQRGGAAMQTVPSVVLTYRQYWQYWQYWQQDCPTQTAQTAQTEHGIYKHTPWVICHSPLFCLPGRQTVFDFSVLLLH
jgi:hypothetical protein